MKHTCTALKHNLNKVDIPTIRRDIVNLVEKWKTREQFFHPLYMSILHSKTFIHC
jgi:3-dehydroquinate dehydratase